MCEGGLKKPRTPQHDLAKNFFVGRIFLPRDFLEENVWAEFFVSLSEANSKLLMLFFLKWVVIFHHLQTEEKEEEKKTSTPTPMKFKIDTKHTYKNCCLGKGTDF